MLNAITIDTDTHTTQTQNRKERKEIFVSDEKHYFGHLALKWSFPEGWLH